MTSYAHYAENLKTKKLHFRNAGPERLND